MYPSASARTRHLLRIKRFANYLEAVGTVEPINVSLLRPSEYNVRSDPGDLSSLMGSVRAHGLLEPILVRPVENHFEIVAGHRRFEACRRLGWQEIPAIVKTMDDKQAYEISLIENVQRETLNPLEEAEAYKRYVMEYGYGSVTELALQLGKSEEYVSHRILLLDLPASVLEKLSRHQLTPSAAQELVWLQDEQKQTDIARHLTNYELSVNQLRQAIKLVKLGFEPDDVFKEIRQKRETVRKLCARSASEKRILEHSILVLRMAMTRLDALIEDIDSNPTLREFLIEQRFTVHQLIDNCIKLKADLSEEEGHIPKLRIEDKRQPSSPEWLTNEKPALLHLQKFS
jgi:ParB family chromosome partitioning protein